MVASERLGGAPRAGDTRRGVVVVKGVETIDATKADAAFWGLGHGYLASSPKILHDLHGLIVSRLRAAQRGNLEQVVADGGVYWRFK